ncbi:hypothetical protein KAU08_08285, partial [bacterium]|nr:hypothetical protein [bacterium]
EMYQELDPMPGTLILGSSRVGSVDPEIVEQLTGISCFNWGAPTTGPAGFNAMIHMAVEDYSAPIQIVIVGVDPEVFHPDRGIHPQAWAAPMYLPYFGDVGIKMKLKRFIRIFMQLFTWEQTSSSFAVLGRELDVATTETPIKYRDDGYTFYTEHDTRIAEGTFNLEGRITNHLLAYPDINVCFTSSDSPSQSKMNKWIEFLEYCDEKGILVFAYLSPMHPRFLDLLSELGADPSHEDISEFLKTTISEHGGIFRDFTHIENFNGDQNLFYDEVHMRKENNARILRNLLSEYRPEPETSVEN